MPLSVPNLTCSPLDDDDKLDAISLVQGSSSLLVEVGMPEVPTHRVEQTEVVPDTQFLFHVSFNSHCHLD